MSILDGMENLGLGHLSSADVYGENEANKATGKTKEKPASASKAKPEETEESFLFQKDFECPVCGNRFKSTVVKTGKARLIGQDKDLRPIHKGVDSLKYDIIHCNKCGYAVLSRYYGPLARPHKEMLKNNIASKYKPMEPVGIVLHYEEALMRYKLALVNAICRQAKDSEKALICLKTAWLMRGMRDHQDELLDMEECSSEKLATQEKEYLKEALDGFVKARMNETPPIAGMNDVTLDYLLSVLSIQFGKYEDAAKLLQSIITSKTAGDAQKDKARDLIIELKEALKKSN